MPKIVITEQDLTGLVLNTNVSNTVYVPIRINIDGGPEIKDRCTKPYSCNSVDDLNKAIYGEDYYTKEDRPTTYDKDLDFKICKHLINIGFQIIVQGWVTTGQESVTTGYSKCNCKLPSVTGWLVQYKADPASQDPATNNIPKSFFGDTWPQSDEELTAAINSYIAGDPNPNNLSFADLSGSVTVAGQSYTFIAPTGSDVSKGGFTGYTAGIYTNYSDVTDVVSLGPATTEYGELQAYDVSEDIPSGGSSKEEQVMDSSQVQIEDKPTTIGTHKYYIPGTGDPAINYTYHYAGGSVPSTESSDTLIYRVSDNASYIQVTDAIYSEIRTDFTVTQGVSSDGWRALRDKGLYDIRFLTNGTFPADSEIVACANARGDCIAAINIDEGTYDGAPISGFDYTVTGQGGVREAFEVFKQAGVEYAAGFTPWFYTINTELAEREATKDPDSGRTIVTYKETLIPAAYGYLFAYANALKTAPEWYAVAGFQRGIIPELLRPAHDYTSAEIEILQARGREDEVPLDDEYDNVGFAINPIAWIRPAGYIIWGNRTMRINDAAKKTIATSFLNVRNGVSAIKKTLYDAARKYTFEQNNEVLWVNFQAYCRPLLDRMQSGNGILGYRWIKLPTTAKARLKAQLKIVPIEAVEDFELAVILTDDLEVVED